MYLFYCTRCKTSLNFQKTLPEESGKIPKGDVRSSREQNSSGAERQTMKLWVTNGGKKNFPKTQTVLAHGVSEKSEGMMPHIGVTWHIIIYI